MDSPGKTPQNSEGAELELKTRGRTLDQAARGKRCAKRGYEKIPDVDPSRDVDPNKNIEKDRRASGIKV